MAELENIPQQVKDQHLSEARHKGRMPTLSRDVGGLRLQHRLQFFSALPQTHIGLDGSYQFTTTSFHKIDASKAPLKTLKRMSIQDLRLEEARKGGYVILRTLEPAFKLVGITTIVEDHVGNAVLFSVYNFTDDLNANLTDILPVGTVFILKEPYIKISASGHCMLRCDCPSDIIILCKGHNLFHLTKGISWKNSIDLVIDPVFRDPTPKTALEWKDRGNALFRENKFDHATRSYLLSLQALAKPTENSNLMRVVLLNLSAVYLQRGFFENSLKFSKEVLEIDPGNKKALDRAGRSCYALRKYEDAERYFSNWHSHYPEDDGAMKELQKTRERVLEQTTGEFKIYEMLLIQSLTPRKKIDCADYTGPIKVVEIPGKGRGIVAKRDLEPGTWLAVSKALVYDWCPDKVTHFQLNHDNTADIGNRQLLITQLAQRIAKNPNTFGPIVYDLFDGHHPVKIGRESLFCDPETRQEPIVDVQRINDILTANCFSENCLIPQETSCSKLEMMIRGVKGGGLFTLPSYFNHSCVPNAIWYIINDVMFIRSIQFIKMNEEVFVPYFSWDLDFSERQSLCEKRGFQCVCKLCEQDGNVTVATLSTRKSIRSRYDKIATQMKLNQLANKNAIRLIRNLIHEMNTTYDNPKEVHLNATLLSMYSLLADAYAADVGSYKTDMMVYCLNSILKLFGFDPQILLESIEVGNNLIGPNSFLVPQALYAFANLVVIHHDDGPRGVNRRNKWLKILCAMEMIFCGGDVNVVKFKYNQINKQGIL